MVPYCGTLEKHMGEGWPKKDVVEYGNSSITKLHPIFELIRSRFRAPQLVVFVRLGPLKGSSGDEMFSRKKRDSVL